MPRVLLIVRSSSILESRVRVIQKLCTLELTPQLAGHVPLGATVCMVRSVYITQLGVTEVVVCAPYEQLQFLLKNERGWVNPEGWSAKSVSVALILAGIVGGIVPGTPGMGFLFFIGVDRLLGTRFSDTAVGMCKMLWRKLFTKERAG